MSARPAVLVTRKLPAEFKRRIKCAPPSAETAAILFWALFASGQITRVVGWQTHDQAPVEQPLDFAA